MRHLELLSGQWAAEWAYFNSSYYYAGEGGRYGLGAGPTAPWCAAGAGYAADQLIDLPGYQGCRFFSPNAVAGYAPVAPALIEGQLLALLASGETVLAIADGADASASYEVLWRKSLLGRDELLLCPWGTCGITTVDFAAELFGAATLLLPGGAAFFVTHTDHWPS